MKSLLAHLKFLPHGNQLLTPSAEFWFFSARILVFAMATAEAIAWGYLGFLFGEGATRWIGAAFAGTTIFLVVWMIDVSLVTMDRAWREHARDILGEGTASSHHRTWRELSTFAVRIGLMAGSLYITAPYLAQVVFYHDIQRYIDSEATGAIDVGRKQIEGGFSPQVLKKDKEIEERRAALEREVAGQGLSGRHGIGPTAKTLLSNLEHVEDERKQIVQSRDSALAAYDTLAKDWRANRDALAAKYNVDLPQTSILENRKALEELRKRPENRSTELAIKAFLAFIFAGLLLLKLFEPSSVKLYLSEVLQQEYDSYLAGTFDGILPATEQSRFRPTSMSPQRFHQFLVHEWFPARKRQREAKDSEARALTLVQLEDIRVQAERELTAAKASYEQARGKAEKTKRDLDELNSAIDIVKEDIRHFESLLGRLVQETKITEEGNLDQLDEETRLEFEGRRLKTDSRRYAFISEQKRNLTEANIALSNLMATKASLEDEAGRAKTELHYFEGRLHEKETELTDVEVRIRNIRREVGKAGSHFSTTTP